MSRQVPLYVAPPKPKEEEKQQFVFVRENGRLVPYKVKEVQKLPTLKKEEEIKEEVLPVQKRRLFITPTRGEEISDNENLDINYSPTFIEAIKERVKSVFEPLFSSSDYKEVERKVKYKPRMALKKKVIIKPKDFYKYFEDNDYEPHLRQITVEDFAPKNKNVMSFSPQDVQESYPVFTYATYGLPDTYIDQYAPEESVKINPVTEFEIRAKPKPIIISQSYLLLLNRLLSEVL